MYIAKYRGWPLPNRELTVINHSGLSDPIPAKELTDVGNNRSAEAKIGGMTPGTLILRGRWEESPEKILFPTCLLGYWTIIFLWDLSIKTINAMTAIANTKIIIIET